MLAYVTLGSNRIEEAKTFYDALMPVIGFAPMMEHGSGGRIYSGKDGMFAVVGPFDGKPASVGNGTMIGFRLESRENVDRFHAQALASGGTDEGAPGLRGPEEARTYMAYARDLDGNKICAFCFG
jgi:catechol 2,3-dioxygenase-like lactoylglutathione lyase family enzyme